jgi:hypothetical protein
MNGSIIRRGGMKNAGDLLAPGMQGAPANVDWPS